MPVPPFPFRNTPDGIVRKFFHQKYRRIFDKVALQVRRSPRRQTGKWKTNRECRWKLTRKHPDYTSRKQIPLIEAKLFAMALEFDGAPEVPAEVRDAAAAVLGKALEPGAYRCPVSGRQLSFAQMRAEAAEPKHGRSSFHVGHVRPKAMGGQNTADNTYWTSDLGNRIQGDKSWADTVKAIIEMAEFQRVRHGNIAWGELVNRYLG